MSVMSAREVIESGWQPGRLANVSEFIRMIERPTNDWERFDGLRGFYSRLNTDEWTPYPVDWMKVFTPIEKAVWGDMRYAAVFMWPQFPVGRYFLDFADPNRRIAVECDGKEWHDRERDMERDAELRELGWTVYRVPGSSCMRTVEIDWSEAANEAELTRWLLETSEGLIRSIAVYYYGRQCLGISREDAVWALKRHASRAAPFIDDGDTN